MRVTVLSQWRLMAAAVLACALLPAQAGAALPPVAQFFQEHAMAAPAFSPDGRKLAFLQRPAGGKARLVVLDLQTFTPAVAAAFRDDDVAGFRWVNERRLVYYAGVVLTGPGTTKSAAGLYAANADGTGFRQLVDTTEQGFLRDGGDARELLPWNTWLSAITGKQDGDQVFVETPEHLTSKSADYYRLRRLNTVNGHTAEVDTPLHSYRWLLDQQGELRVAVARDGKTTSILYRGDGGKWTTLDQFDSYVGGGMEPLFLDAAGKLYVRAANGDKAALFTYDTHTLKRDAQPILASPEFDLYPRLVTREGKVLGIRYTVDAEVTNWIDPGMKAVQDQVDALLPNTANRISVPAHGTGQFVLVDAFSDVQPDVFLLYDTGKHKLVKVGASLPAFDPAQLGRTEFVHYKARDGMTIPAWLTMPPGERRKNLPMVVLVHGGPFVRGGAWDWDPQAQFLASRGYVVLQPEFRGSTGFGYRHFHAGWKQWGMAMQDDLADGARWVAGQGIADPARICIAGASYGGYATLMGLAKDGQLFRCGVDWVGVTDLNLLYDVGWSDTSDEYKKWGMPALVGDQVEDAAQLKATSPIAQAARITQPLLLAYGGYDVRVPIVHGEKFRDAVKAYNQKVEWVEYDNEGHGWRHQENRIDFWTRVEKFLAQQIGSTPAP